MLNPTLRRTEGFFEGNSWQIGVSHFSLFATGNSGPPDYDGYVSFKICCAGQITIYLSGDLSSNGDRVAIDLNHVNIYDHISSVDGPWSDSVVIPLDSIPCGNTILLSGEPGSPHVDNKYIEATITSIKWTSEL